MARVPLAQRLAHGVPKWMDWTWKWYGFHNFILWHPIFHFTCPCWTTAVDLVTLLLLLLPRGFIQQTKQQKSQKTVLQCLLLLKFYANFDLQHNHLQFGWCSSVYGLWWSRWSGRQDRVAWTIQSPRWSVPMRSLTFTIIWIRPHAMQCSGWTRWLVHCAAIERWINHLRREYCSNFGHNRHVASHHPLPFPEKSEKQKEKTENPSNKVS